MDQRERYFNEEETLRIAFESMQARIWTAMPGIVLSFDPVKMLVTAQPTINGVTTDQDGNESFIQMPPIPDMPVLWMGGGGVTATFPIKAGNECLMIFGARCIDSWFAQGWIAGGSPYAPNAANNPSEKRMHNLSDGFALVGIRSLPNTLSGVSTTAAQLRSDDGSTVFSLDPNAQTVSATAPGGIDLNGLHIDSSGNLSTAGNISSTAGTVNAKTAVSVNGVDLTVP